MLKKALIIIFYERMFGETWVLAVDYFGISSRTSSMRYFLLFPRTIDGLGLFELKICVGGFEAVLK